MACIDKVVLETKERCLCNFCNQLKDFIGEQEEQCFAHKLKETDNMLNDVTGELLTDAPPITQQSVSVESDFDIGIPPGYISDPNIDQCDLDNAADLIRCFGSRLEHDLPLDEVVKRVQKVTKMLVFSGVPLTGWAEVSRSLLRSWKLRNQAIEHDKLIEATEASMVLQSQYVDDLRAQHVSIDGELSTKNLSLSSFKEVSASIQSKINQTKAELDELQKKFAHVTDELNAEAKLCINLEGRRRDVDDQLSTALQSWRSLAVKRSLMKSDRNRDTAKANVAVEQAIKNITSLSYGVEKAVEKECALNYQAMEEPLEELKKQDSMQGLRNWFKLEDDRCSLMEKIDGLVRIELGDSLEVCYKKDLEAAESELIDQLNVWRSMFSDDCQWQPISRAEKRKVLEACNSAVQLLSVKERQGLLPELVDLKSATQELNGLYKRPRPTWSDYVDKLQQ